MPEAQRNFATKENLPACPEKIAAPYRIGAKLHLLTIEQNALTSFKNRTTCALLCKHYRYRSLFLQAGNIIGGCGGTLGCAMGWQGMRFLTTLHYGPAMNVTFTFMPTLPGNLFYIKELAGPSLWSATD